MVKFVKDWGIFTPHAYGYDMTELNLFGTK